MAMAGPIVRLPKALVPTKDIQRCVVSHLVDPDEIYVQCHLDGVTPLRIVQERLQSDCELLCSDILLPEPLESIIGTCWAAKFSSDQKWYRVEVIKIIDDKSVIDQLEDLSVVEITVKFVDYGNCEDTTIGNLKKLPNDLVDVPPHSLKCHLAYIKPFGKRWVSKALDLLDELTNFTDDENDDKWPVLMHVIGKSNDSFKVFMWNKDAFRIDANVVLLNARFVIDGLAVSDLECWVEEYQKQRRKRANLQIASSHIASVAYRESVSKKRVNSSKTNHNNASHECEELSSLAKWDPMEDHSSDSKNSYYFNEGDINTRLYGYPLKDIREICHYYFKNGKCRHGKDCHKKHIKMDDDSVLDQEDVCIRTICEKLVFWPHEIIDVLVTAIKSPASFYCVPKCSRECSFGRIEPTDYEILGREMRKYYKLALRKENSQILPSPGSLVAYRNPLKSTYERGIILEVLVGDEDCLVHCIDSGFEYEVERQHIYKLDNSFAVLPPFAIHCSIANITPKPTTSFIWSNNAIEYFKHLVKKITCPKILVKTIDYYEKIEVELFQGESFNLYVSQDMVEKQIASYLKENN